MLVSPHPRMLKCFTSYPPITLSYFYARKETKQNKDLLHLWLRGIESNKTCGLRTMHSFQWVMLRFVSSSAWVRNPKMDGPTEALTLNIIWPPEPYHSTQVCWWLWCGSQASSGSCWLSLPEKLVVAQSGGFICTWKTQVPTGQTIAHGGLEGGETK